MERSAHSLTPTFQALALQSWLRPADIALRQTIGRLGRVGEQQMMAATGGVNTHRGAIWALGLLVSAVAMLAAMRARLLLQRPPPHWRNCRMTPRPKFSVKGFALRTAIAYPVPEKRHSRPSRIFCSCVAAVAFEPEKRWQ
jgi:triphosphoribosyl-dephospho-CoA synthase